MFKEFKENDFGEIFVEKWEEWEHFLIPNKPMWLRNIMRNFMAKNYHCLKCTALDGCYFLKSKKPNLPLHINCDCQVKELSIKNVKEKIKAFCDIRKFTEYVFSNENSKGKNKLFYNLGYGINDSEMLAKEYCVQAEKQYFSGNYVLKNLDEKGQRIAIPIILNSKMFYTGWMLYPEGEIRNTTPFGGWIK